MQDAVKHVIATNQARAKSLNRTIFSDNNIAPALDDLMRLFPSFLPK